MSKQETAFQTFVFGRLRDHVGGGLSANQQIAFDYWESGMGTKEISIIMGITRSSVCSIFTTIRKKGWAM